MGSMRGARLEAALVACVLAVLAVLVAPTIGQPLLEAHGFRQTQTAFPARFFHEDGIDLFHPKVPVLGDPFEVPFEFPLFQLAASFAMDLGLDEEVALRLTGAACFVATALLLYGLVRRIAGRVSAFGALVAFALSPFALGWSRTSMIEYLATAGAVGFTWALIAWRENRRPLVGGVALAAGLVAMLVKPTTAIFWVAPGLLYRLGDRSDRPSSRLGGRAGTAAIVLLPILAAAAWTRHADGVKGDSEATEPLTSSALREWNFGTIDQRLDPAVWEVFGERTVVVLGLGVFLLPVAIAAAFRSAQRGFWLAIAVAGVVPLLVFTNLYFVHDYYFAAVSPALAALVGLAVGYLHARFPRSVVRPAAVVGLVAVAFTLWASHGYWERVYNEDSDPMDVMPVAREVESLTRPDDVVAMVGFDWSPAILYYAHRRGHMQADAGGDSSIEQLHDAGYRHLVAADPYEDSISFLGAWSWVGALGRRTFAIGDTSDATAEAQVVATSARVALPSGPELLRSPRRIGCGEPAALPAGRRGTWIRLRDPASEARILVSDGLAPVPARPLVFVDADVGRRGMLTISCSGAPSLTVTSVLDAGR
jgi:Dolichyl-phosphate-mannose-protein mannosyltransferase